VTAVLDDPATFDALQPIAALPASSARDTALFVLGDSNYLAVASNFDGSQYRTSSKVYLIVPQAGPTFFQALATSGAYGVAAFSVDGAGAGGGAAEADAHFLAFAEHYDDVEGYETHSHLFRWNETTQVPLSPLPAPMCGKHRQERPPLGCFLER